MRLLRDIFINFAEKYGQRMKKQLIYSGLAALVALFMVGCGGKKDGGDEEPKVADAQYVAKNDSMLYGLVCDGCTDSVLVFLPADDSDPVRYDIIDATQGHKVFGRLKIGDWVAICVDREDRKVADLVVDLDQLKGTWCYTVMPQFRDFATMSKRMQRRMMNNMPDSVKQTFLIPREYGFTLKRQYSASPVGMVMGGNSLEDDSPVVYPEVPMYSEWHLWNGRLVLTRTLGLSHPGAAHNGRMKFVNDTASFVMMTPDTLVLAFGDRTQGYSRKANAMDVNKKARVVAAQQAQKAIDETKTK